MKLPEKIKHKAILAIILFITVLVTVSCSKKVAEVKPEEAKKTPSAEKIHIEKQEEPDEIAEPEPEDAAAHFNVAEAYYERKDFNKAIEHYSKTVELKPNAVEAYFYLGNAYYFNKDYAKALECFKKVVKLNPDFEEAYYNIEMVSEKLKKK